MRVVTPAYELPESVTVCVIGLGYIGLPTAAVLADRGHRVHGVDVRSEIVETINRGEIHIHEPHLDTLVRRVVGTGRLSASLQPQPADVFVICVPTPVTEDLAPDLAYVRQASEAIRPFVREGNLIILESTSPPGTTDKVVASNAVPVGMKVGQDVFVAHCPERVLPGRILIEVIENDRIVGGVTPCCTERAAAFYGSFVEGKVLTSSALNAEFAKLAENSFRDVNIAFANELSMMAEMLGADPLEIIELANRHPRVSILTPGPGVGGHCISVDPWFLVHAAPDDTPLIRTAREVNNRKPHFVVDKVIDLVHQSNISTVACLGLTYKADVDDLRESPSLEIVRELRKREIANILVCDPYVSPRNFHEFPLHSLEEVLDRCEALVLLTDHHQFREIPSSLLERKLVVDTRGIWRNRASDAATLPDSLRKSSAKAA